MKPSRLRVVEEIADSLAEASPDTIVRVGIDGVDGAGKTMLADELAAVLRQRGMHVIRASVDGFHHPREVRYRQGRWSPVGYFRDSFDYNRLREVLLDPLSPGGSRRYVDAIYDVANEQSVTVDQHVAVDGSVLVLDGVFLHRAELVPYWDASVFVEVDRHMALDRMARRDGTDRDPSALRNRRYLQGQHLYLEQCRPADAATFVVDNNDLDRPSIVRRSPTAT